MAVPRNRTSNARKNSRRSTINICKEKRFQNCKSCGTAKLLHHACSKCGHYK